MFYLLGSRKTSLSSFSSPDSCWDPLSPDKSEESDSPSDSESDFWFSSSSLASSKSFTMNFLRLKSWYFLCFRYSNLLSSSLLNLKSLKILFILLLTYGSSIPSINMIKIYYQYLLSLHSQLIQIIQE